MTTLDPAVDAPPDLALGVSAPVRHPAHPAYPAHPAHPGSGELDRVLRAGALHALFQPVHDLRTGRAVAVEGFVRGPQDGALSSPAQLFRAASAAGRVGDLDRAAQEVVLAGAAALPGAWPVFVNSSPDGVGDDLPTPPGPTGPVVLDVPARTLRSRPGAALRLARRARERGWSVALDDLGADPGVLALLPVLRPDVVKLDLRLLARRTAEEVAVLAGAVGAFAARHGALVLAESVEDAADLATARALGADLVQGWGVAHVTRTPAGEPGPVALPAPRRRRPTPWPAWAPRRARRGPTSWSASWSSCGCAPGAGRTRSWSSPSAAAPRGGPRPRWARWPSRRTPTSTGTAWRCWARTPRRSCCRARPAARVSAGSP